MKGLPVPTIVLRQEGKEDCRYITVVPGLASVGDQELMMMEHAAIANQGFEAGPYQMIYVNAEGLEVETEDKVL